MTVQCVRCKVIISQKESVSYFRFNLRIVVCKLCDTDVMKFFKGKN